MKRQEKEQVVADLRERFGRCRMAIVTDYKGLNVETLTALRSELRNAGVEYRVVKNTLVKRASKDSSAAILNPHMTGPCALALCYNDSVASAKVIVDFKKKNDRLKIKGGFLADRVLTEAEVTELAKLPGREELMAKLLGTMNAVPANFVRVLHNVLQKFLGTLVAVKEQKEGAVQD